MKHLLAVAIVFLFSVLTPKAAADGTFIQIEGLVLGYFPELADGVHVTQGQGPGPVQITPGHRCFQKVETEAVSGRPNSVSFENEEPRVIRNRLRGLLGYFGTDTNPRAAEEWLKTATGLASQFYRDNLIEEATEDEVQLLFLPMVLAPKPVSVVRAQWTEVARQIMERQGWAGVQRYCGTHFVQTVGEEAFVVYSIRVKFPNGEERRRFERVRNSSQTQAPTTALNNLHRMRERFEFYGPGRAVELDILQVGGRQKDIEALRLQLRDLNAEVEMDSAGTDSHISRVRLNCGTERIRQCQTAAQAFLDFQFRRFNFSGEKPAFSPIRFRIAPITLVGNISAD